MLSVLLMFIGVFVGWSLAVIIISLLVSAKTQDLLIENDRLKYELADCKNKGE